MRKYTLAVLAVMLLVPLLATAQTAPPTIRADVPFSFMVEGKSYPAGLYSFAENATMGTITVMSVKGRQEVVVPYLTRLSMRSPDQSEVVFDVVGNDHYLSEIYLPGIDGFSIKAAPAKHTHVVIKQKK